MNKNTFIRCLGLFLIVVLGTLELNALELPSMEGSLLEFRVSYFAPTDSDFRDVFHDGDVDYQLSGNLPICQDSCDMSGTNLWLAIDYFSKSNRSSVLHNHVSIRSIPLTLGLKYFFSSVSMTLPLNFYVGAGLKYFFVHTHNNAPSARHTIDKNGLGGVVEAGFLTDLCDNYVLDFFVSYSFKSFKAHSTSNPGIEMTRLDVSGVNTGVGIGYKF